MTLGLTGLVVLLGERMGLGSPSTAGRTLRAAALLVTAGLAPVVGWFILTPLALLTDLGAILITLARRASRTLGSTA